MAQDPYDQPGNKYGSDSGQGSRFGRKPQNPGEKSAGAGELQNAESGGGGDPYGTKWGGKYASDRKKKGSDDSSDQKDAEENSSEDSGGTGSTKGRFRGFVRRNKKKVAAGLAGTGVLGGVLLGGIAQGPLQSIHLSEILQRNEHSNDESVTSRISKFWRFKNSGSYGETRVGSIGSKFVNKAFSDLKDIGIEFDTTNFDHVKAINLDAEKMKAQFPEMEGMSDAQQKAFYREVLNLPDDAKVTGSNGKFKVDTRGFSYKQLRGLRNNAIDVTNNGKLVSRIMKRQLGKFLDIPRAFHPSSIIKKAKQNLDFRQDARTQRKADEARRAELEKPVTGAAEEPVKTLKDKIKSSGLKTAGRALMVTGGLCLVRSIADDVVKANRAAIVLPVVAEGLDKETFGEQVKSGQDIDTNAVGGEVASFTNTAGQSVWEGKAMQATAGTAQTGEDLPTNFVQAFNNNTTAQSIKDTIGSPTFEGHDLGGIACSKFGIAIQFAAGLGLAFAAISTAPESGGASIAAQAALIGAKGAATAGVMYMISTTFTNALKSDAIVPKTLDGPLGGNLLAYGAREGANISARTAGGVDLSSQEEGQLAAQQEKKEQQQFRSESFFARMFDSKDYRSLTGRLADSISPSFAKNMASLSGSFMNLGSLLSHTFSALLPRAHAADKPYQWPFPKVGIPSAILNDPQMADPYANAGKVAAIFDAGDPDGYIPRAKACFGVDIAKGADGWDVTPVDDVDPHNDDYVDAHCNHIDNDNWKRVILFVFDTNTIKAAACYQGDDQSCTDVGYGGGDTGGNNDEDEAPTDDANIAIDLAHLYDSSVDIKCAPGTKDLGVQDGYHEGKKVPIRVCALKNVQETGSTSDIQGANGKLLVNSNLSAFYVNLVAAAKKDGVSGISAQEGFRTMARQKELQSTGRAAPPGYSNHQMGVAIDWSNSMVEWLNKTGSKYGLKALVADEPWHWSPTGN